MQPCQTNAKMTKCKFLCKVDVIMCKPDDFIPGVVTCQLQDICICICASVMSHNKSTEEKELSILINRAVADETNNVSQTVHGYT